MSKQASLLIDEPPILVYPTLASKLGINKAVVIQQLHFLLNSAKSSNSKYNFVDGKWWVYNSYADWKTEHFTWLSESSIKRFFLELEQDGLVESQQGVKHPNDREKWYTIDYAAWEKFMLRSSDQNSLMEGLKESDQTSDQNSLIIGLKESDESLETPVVQIEIKDLPAGEIGSKGVAPFDDVVGEKGDDGDAKPTRHREQHALVKAIMLPLYGSATMNAKKKAVIKEFCDIADADPLYITFIQEQVLPQFLPKASEAHSRHKLEEEVLPVLRFKTETIWPAYKDTRQPSNEHEDMSNLMGDFQ